jgi:hypothetical protein
MSCALIVRKLTSLLVILLLSVLSVPATADVILWGVDAGNTRAVVPSSNFSCCESAQWATGSVAGSPSYAALTGTPWTGWDETPSGHNVDVTDRLNVYSGHTAATAGFVPGAAGLLDPSNVFTYHLYDETSNSDICCGLSSWAIGSAKYRFTSDTAATIYWVYDYVFTTYGDYHWWNSGSAYTANASQTGWDGNLSGFDWNGPDPQYAPGINGLHTMTGGSAGSFYIGTGRDFEFRIDLNIGAAGIFSCDPNAPSCIAAGRPAGTSWGDLKLRLAFSAIPFSSIPTPIPTNVPEPGTTSMLLAGLALLELVTKRRLKTLTKTM